MALNKLIITLSVSFVLLSLPNIKFKLLVTFFTQAWNMNKIQ